MSKPLPIYLLALVCATILALSCGGAPEGGDPETPDDNPIAERRTAAVDDTSEYYPRVEGFGFANECVADTDCVVSGCSREVCAAEQVTTTCEVIPWPQAGIQCGCVDAECIWYR